jgi:hypothetical protein
MYLTTYQPTNDGGNSEEEPASDRDELDHQEDTNAEDNHGDSHEDEGMADPDAYRQFEEGLDDLHYHDGQLERDDSMEEMYA